MGDRQRARKGERERERERERGKKKTEGERDRERRMERGILCFLRCIAEFPEGSTLKAMSQHDGDMVYSSL